jgi:lipopolysaccharide/colanic/teichoic acid biosynthesis glycosyltransferase
LTRDTGYRRFGKRAFDVVGASAAILLLLPVGIGVALLILAAMGTPVFFRQRRPGLDGIPFVLVKFRSMEEPHDPTGRPQADGERLTRFGRFLRASSLDEIPELWNVLKGDMSLVGPRPLLMEYLPLYARHQARRHEVKPGITGLAQVNGRNALVWAERFRLDVEYVERHCFLMDLTILARTAWQVLGSHGIAQPGRATVDYFQGDAKIDG